MSCASLRSPVDSEGGASGDPNAQLDACAIESFAIQNVEHRKMVGCSRPLRSRLDPQDTNVGPALRL
jgi:hypothetical protein